jgi:hypothetical protein
MNAAGAQLERGYTGCDGSIRAHANCRKKWHPRCARRHAYVARGLRTETRTRTMLGPNPCVTPCHSVSLRVKSALRKARRHWPRPTGGHASLHALAEVKRFPPDPIRGRLHHPDAIEHQPDDRPGIVAKDYAGASPRLDDGDVPEGNVGHDSRRRGAARPAPFLPLLGPAQRARVALAGVVWSGALLDPGLP